MIIDNIIVITVAIILITYLSINYVKKYAPVNLFLIAICAFSLGIYLPVVFYNVYLRIRYQIPLGIGLLFYQVFLLFYNIIILRLERIYYSKEQKNAIMTKNIQNASIIYKN